MDIALGITAIVILLLALVGAGTIGFIIARIIYLKWFFQPSDAEIEIKSLEKQVMYFKSTLERKEQRLDDLVLLFLENKTSAD